MSKYRSLYIASTYTWYRNLSPNSRHTFRQVFRGIEVLMDRIPNSKHLTTNRQPVRKFPICVIGVKVTEGYATVLKRICSSARYKYKGRSLLQTLVKSFFSEST